MLRGKNLSILVILSYVLMIAANSLANILPINGVSTGEVSDKYGNLFAPAAYVFLIWVVIYLLLGAYSGYQFKLFRRRPDMSDRVIHRVNQYFLYSSLLNGIWIILWHYDLILLTVLVMILILFLLARARIIISHRSNLSPDEIYFVKWPFSIYFAWITVATIANITTYLVSISWDRWGQSEELWTMLMIVIGAVIGVVSIIRLKDIVYGCTIMWAYTGILVKHVTATGFAKQYPNAIIVVIVSEVLFVISMVYVIYLLGKIKRKKNLIKEKYGDSTRTYESNEYYEDEIQE